MNPALSRLRKELAGKRFKQGLYSIGKLPLIEGYCIIQDEEAFQVFWFERGSKFELTTHTNVISAIAQFKQMLQSNNNVNK